MSTDFLQLISPQLAGYAFRQGGGMMAQANLRSKSKVQPTSATPSW